MKIAVLRHIIRKERESTLFQDSKKPVQMHRLSSAGIPGFEPGTDGVRVLAS